MTKKLKLVMFFVVTVMFTFILNMTVLANEVQRFSGSDRYGTALEISRANWQKSDYVVIATGNDFPDALCATPLAKKYNAPILLSEPVSLSAAVIAEIQRLGAKEAFLIGGNGVISPNIENVLNSMGIHNIRLAGADRFETSLKIAQQVGPSPKAIIATGSDFPDAISVSVPASIETIPILLTTKNAINEPVKAFIKAQPRTVTYIIGGTGVVSDAVMSQFDNPKRLSGSNRVATNLAVINEFMPDFKLDQIFTATALDFPDGLTGAAAAALTQSPLFILEPGNTNASLNYISSRCSQAAKFTILGGTGVIDANIAQTLSIIKAKLVVIDAGHGGYDSGAVGPTGVKEKNVNIAVALKLGPLLQAHGVRVEYTRTSDAVSWSTDIVNDLQTRCDIANNLNADIFVCIHSNSATNPAANGTETYYTTLKPQDLALAQAIQTSLVNTIRLYDRKVQTADYWVLKHTNMPAALVELGFINNPTEEQLLNNTDFQNKCAQGIAQGILNYAK